LFGGNEIEFELEVTSEETPQGRLLVDQLVGNLDAVGVDSNIAAVVEETEDLLLLASLAARHRCQCVGWQAFFKGAIKTHYFSNRSLQNKHNSSNPFRHNKLIEQQNFISFMNTSLISFNKFEDKVALRRAINGLLHGIEPGVEDRLLTLFAAVETIITAFRKRKKLEHIVDADGWKQLERAVKTFIKQSLDPKLDDTQRKMLYGKIPELNRVSFGDALSEFIAEFSLDVADLWPIIGPNSLAKLRNRIIHGETFSHSEMEGIVVAKMHLQWYLERMLLAVLGWPHENSGVSKGALQRWSAYRDAEVPIVRRP
jgi:hypothetical protein